MHDAPPVTDSRPDAALDKAEQVQGSVAEEAAPVTNAALAHSRFGHAWAVLWLGLRTVFAATVAAWRQPPTGADADSSTPAGLLESAQQHTLQTALAEAQAQIERLRSELEASLRLQHDRENDIRELKSQMQFSAGATADAEGRLRAELERAQEIIAHGEGEISRLTEQVAQLTADVQNRQSAFESSQSELAAARADAARQTAEVIAGRETALNVLKQQASRDQDELRDQLRQAHDAAQQAATRNTELETRIDDLVQREHALARAGLRDSRQVRESFQRELQRKSTQFDALNQELATHRTRAQKLEELIREFYLQAIDPVTVAAASADLAASSAELGAADRENVTAVREKLDIFLPVLKRLVAELNELGISTGSKS